MFRKIALGLIVVFLLVAWGRNANAQSVRWTNPATGGAAGVWSSSANWNPATVPGPLNTAEIGNGGEARITSNVSTSRIEVGKNGGTGTLTSTAAVTISTDSDFDVGETGEGFAAGPATFTSNGTANITDALSLNIGTGGVGDLDIGQASAQFNAQAFGTGVVNLRRINNVMIAENVEIGKSGGSATASGQGTLLVDSVGTFNVTVDLDIGQVSGNGQSTGVGKASIYSTSNVVVGDGIDVGFTSGSTSSTNSGNGTLFVSNSMVSVGFADPLLPGSLHVGTVSAVLGTGAQGQGTATFEQSSLSVANSITVGKLSGGSTTASNSSQGSLTLIDSTISALSLEVATVLDASAGSVDGTVNLDSSLMTLTGPLTLGPNSILEFGLAGTTKADGTGSAGQFSAIDATLATLDGTLNVFLTDGFVPSAGDTFQILSGARTGTFNPVDFPVLPGGLSWDIQYDPSAVTLQVLGSSFTADFDNDGDVDGSDLTTWETSFGAGAGADADGDEDSDGADFLAWQRQFGSGVPVLSATQAVPEPTTFFLCLFGMPFVTGRLVLLNCRRHRVGKGEGN
ncbi:MAG: hypothetical protein GXP24_04160 [Planctomycetes bacterium]|nr:hypothetical protein [Planctomycetota bacterium]